MYLGMGNTKKALFLAEESVTLDRKIGNERHLSFSVCMLGLIYLIMGEWEKGEQYL
jgi:hypothetical protein